MGFDQQLAERVRRSLAGTDGLDEQALFGGLGFLLHGNMACGVIDDRLVVRIGKNQHEKAMKNPHVRPFDYPGRAISGWITVLPSGLKEADDLNYWVHMGLSFTGTLPAK
jgi:hypothetical protein